VAVLPPQRVLTSSPDFKKDCPMTHLTSRFSEALSYAAAVHADQRRKGTEIPYISHPLAVASLVIQDGGDEDESRFGVRVADIVAACSDTMETPKPPWRPRKEAYLRRLGSEHDAGILRVSLADKLDNARAMLRDYLDVGAELWDRFNAGRDEQLWYLRSLVDLFASRSSSPMTGELRATVVELKEKAEAG
jgi:(p)ppGpp synthase/HD superfamily hydrolase